MVKLPYLFRDLLRFQNQRQIQLAISAGSSAAVAHTGRRRAASTGPRQGRDYHWVSFHDKNFCHVAGSSTPSITIFAASANPAARLKSKFT